MSMEKLKYSLILLIGAISYGILAMIVKLAYKDGFVAEEVVFSQYFFGWLLILFLFLFSSRKLPTKQSIIQLGLIGMMSVLTGIFYGKSLEEVPASIAVVLLFQFTWLGMLVDLILNRRRPNNAEIIAILLLFIGTFLAGAVFEETYFQWTWSGIIYGLLAAFTFTFFIYFNGKTKPGIPVTIRLFTTASGSLLVAFLLLNPEILWNGALMEGLWKYGLLLGFFGLIIPVYCFSIGVPKVGTSLGSIIGAAELPTAILAASLVLNEPISSLQWLGIFLILIGIALPQLTMKPLRKKGT